MTATTRRRFLQRSAALATSLGLGVFSTRPVLGANGQIRLGIAGAGDRGTQHFKLFGRISGVEIVAIADPDRKRLGSAMKIFPEASGHEDIRRMLDSSDVDAISVATPNHWHALATHWACLAGKDVFVEKPCTHNIYEGEQVLKTITKTGRVVQHAAGKRGSLTHIIQTQVLRDETYGKLRFAKGFCCKPRWSIGRKPVEPPPPHIDYNHWLGPAAETPFHRNLVHYNWHWFWPFGNGDMGNQGVHEIDAVHRSVAAVTGQVVPSSVWSMGGRWTDRDGKRDQGVTPNMLMSVFDFGSVQLIFETRGLVEREFDGKKMPFLVDVEYETTEGVIRGLNFHPHGSDTVVPIPKPPGSKSVCMFKNFIDAVRAGDPSKLISPFVAGHQSCSLIHYGNASYRVGLPVPFGSAEARPKSTSAQSTFNTIRENLAIVKFNPTDRQYQLGPELKIDPITARFTNDTNANGLLTREYRKPYLFSQTHS